MVKIVDFGLVILIWMVQLIIYPSFLYYREEALLEWHEKYTHAITVIVMPLMLAQVIFHALDLYEGLSWINGIAAVLILLIWINTFLFAVPLHSRISNGMQPMEAAEKLVQINWFRTIGWSVVCLLGWFKP